MIVRRFTSDQSDATYSKVEGIVVIDGNPAPTVVGTGGRTVALVGEFPDLTYAASVAADGTVSTSCRPVEVTSSQDVLDKLGGLDTTIGDHGDTCGNGFLSLANKKFTRLVIAPVNLASSKATRLYRTLPGCISATNPNPVVPVQPALVSAGRPFTDGTSTLKLGQRVLFTSSTPLITGTDGATIVRTAFEHTLTSAGSDFTAAGVRAGDILVYGVIGSPSWVGTFRVVTVGTTTLTFQKLDGTALTTTLTSAQPFRVHPASDADTGAQNALYTYGSALATNTNGVTTSATDTSHTFTSSGTNFTTAGVLADDHLILDTVTYKVLTVGTTTLTFGKFDGSSFDPGAATGLTFSVKRRSLVTGNSSCTARVRSLGASTVAAGTACAPSSTDDTAAATATSWLPLSGLKLVTPQAVTYTSTVQAANAVYHSALGTLYGTALTALAQNKSPMRDVQVVFSARKSETIAGLLKQHVLDASSLGKGRSAVISPELTRISLNSAYLGTSWPSVGAVRDERVIYAWPGVRAYVPEMLGVTCEVGDGTNVTNGVIDETFDGVVAMLLGNLPPGNNPGQGADPVPSLMEPFIDFQRAATDISFSVTDYGTMKDQGIAAPIFDEESGTQLQSGITSSITAGRTTIARRAMEDSIQDEMASICKKFNKLPMTPAWKSNLKTAANNYLALRADKAPDPAKRDIDWFKVDVVAGNTAARNAAGIYMLIVTAKTYASADAIVIKTNVGPGVVA